MKNYTLSIRTITPDRVEVFLTDIGTGRERAAKGGLVEMLNALKQSIAEDLEAELVKR